MSPNPRPAASDPSRRQFLHRCAGCALAGGCTLTALGPAARPARARATAAVKPRVRLLFTHIPSGQPTWPYISYDYEGRKHSLTAALVRACPEIELLPITVHTASQAREVLAEDRDVDGYIVYLVGIWTGAAAVVAASGKPTLFVDDLYAGSGEFLTQYAAARRAGRNVAGVASSRLEDVAAAVSAFADIRRPGAAAEFAAACMAAQRRRYAPMGPMAPAPADSAPKFDTAAALRELRESTILLVGAPMQANFAEAITRALGPKVVPLPFETLEAAYQKADPDRARDLAETWIQGAESVVEPTPEDVRKSAAMYLAMKSLVDAYQARAITINCLGGFYGGHLEAYPCLGFCQLNNDGLVGACEADLKSTITMLALGCLVHRPGYIFDPVIDTSKHQIIYAHCVAPSKVFGPDGPTNPYQIRSHSEDRKGASMRSLMPLGRIVTTLELDPSRKQVLFHQAKTVANIAEDRACRTKLAADVKGDIGKLMRHWDQWGWHRVTFYGDLKEPVFALAEKLGFNVIEEA